MIRMRAVVFVCAAVVVPAMGAQGNPRKVAFPIVSGGKVEAAVVAGADLGTIETTAIQHLMAGLSSQSGLTISMQKDTVGAGSLILVGTLKSNPQLKELANDLPADGLAPESFLLKTVQKDGRHCLLILGADEHGVFYGVQEALDQVITDPPGGYLVVTECDVIRKPAVSVRGTYSLSCWGNAPRYDRQAWEKTIDSMSAAGMNRIMFWMDGLFRSRKFPYTFLDKSYFSGAKLTDDDIHQLIKYAHDRGMEFQLGSGVFGWFTSGTFAEKFKEAADHTGTNLCPSHSLAQKMTLEYITEMMDVFPESDGYMLEIRDEIRDCMCKVCQKPLDKFGSKQFGQSELDLLEKLTQTVWKDHPKAKFVWLIGYDNHPHDPMYYERIRTMGKDPRMEWLEVRGSWKLPSADGTDKPLTYFSDQVYIWGGGYYAMKPDDIQRLVQRIVREGFRGYLPAYEPGFGSASIYGERIPFPVDLIPFRLTQFYYREFTWEPAISHDRLLLRAHREFFNDAAPAELAGDLLFLRQIMQDHYPELTCVAPGLIRTNTLAEGIDQIWGDRFMPDKKDKLTQLAQCVRSLETLSKGGGDMARLSQIEGRMNQIRPTASRRTTASLALMQTAISDFRAAVAGRHEDLARSDDTLKRIEAKIKEYEESKGKTERKSDAPSAGG